MTAAGPRSRGRWGPGLIVLLPFLVAGGVFAVRWLARDPKAAVPIGTEMKLAAVRLDDPLAAAGFRVWTVRVDYSESVAFGFRTSRTDTLKVNLEIPRQHPVRGRLRYVMYDDAPAPLPQPMDDKVARLTFFWQW